MSLWEEAGRRAGPERPLATRFTPILGLLLACWAVFLVNNLLLAGHLNRYGIIPRQVWSIPGIIWAPFLHGSLRHLIANTVPLLILGGLICARSKSEFMTVTAAGIVLAGSFTWLFGRSASHIGASGLIFCLFGYLASMALFRRTFGTLLLSAACIIAYGGIVRGIVPTSAGVSWEGHLAGLIAGILLAWFAAKHQRPKAKQTVGSPPAADPSKVIGSPD